ncbi:hypothetical protein BKA59DRAFT_474504 [Fusarium tricinctum]|uniref:Uncharacterized protein n=1 Tax=Fusarium tricinctum TaxID=61284 RepID=A0A8K0WF96_9HYPO|nr:hypothetical protein BKA59DRAFT_474504 [Fusarium tricinctum]
MPRCIILHWLPNVGCAHSINNDLIRLKYVCFTAFLYSCVKMQGSCLVTSNSSQSIQHYRHPCYPGSHVYCLCRNL